VGTLDRRQLHSARQKSLKRQRASRFDSLPGIRLLRESDMELIGRS
jgi:hypothetical protein